MPIPFVPFIDSPLHVDRPLLHRGSVPLCRNRGLSCESFRGGSIAAILIAGLCFLFFPLRFAFPAPLTLTDGSARSSIGFRGVDLPFNSFPSLARRVAVGFWSMFTARNLRGVLLWAVMSWLFLYCSFAIAHLPAPRHRHRRWFCPWPDIASTFFREPSHAPPSCRESPHRLVYAGGSGGCLDYGRDLLAMGSSASLAKRLLSASWRSRTSERVRSLFIRLEESCRGARGFCVGALFTRSISVVACITGANGRIVGQDHTTNLDWRQNSGRRFCE